MINELKYALERARPTLTQDLAGLAALIVMLVVGLHLPSVI